MISQNLQTQLQAMDKHQWLSTGSKLSPHYKNVLKAYGFSPRVYTRLLYKNADISLQKLYKLCEMLGIDIKAVV